MAKRLSSGDSLKAQQEGEEKIRERFHVISDCSGIVAGSVEERNPTSGAGCD
jgi:hypothetical protein